MNPKSSFFTSLDGLKIHYKCWLSDNTQKVVCIVHGLGEHSGRYEHVAKFLNTANISVYALDLRGHGLSEGKRGHTKSYDLILADVEELLKLARVEFIDLPLFLFGHSMGGNLANSLVRRNRSKEIRGFILSSPWFQLAFDPPAWKLKLGTIAATILPSLTQPNGLETRFLSKDDRVVQAYENDPLVHDKISAGLFSDIMSTGAEAISKKADFKIPGLVYHGQSDQIIHAEASQRFSELNNLDWKGYPGVYHEPHNDIEQEEVLQALLDWIEKK